MHFLRAGSIRLMKELSRTFGLRMQICLPVESSIMIFLNGAFKKELNSRFKMLLQTLFSLRESFFQGIFFQGITVLTNIITIVLISVWCLWFCIVLCALNFDSQSLVMRQDSHCSKDEDMNEWDMKGLLKTRQPESSLIGTERSLFSSYSKIIDLQDLTSAITHLSNLFNMTILCIHLSV